MTNLTSKEIEIVAREIAQQLHGSRIKGGDWPWDKHPGGNECSYCGGIFIGDEFRNECKRCSDFKTAVTRTEESKLIGGSMNVEALKKYLEQIPDDFEVLVRESDWIHSAEPKLKCDSDRGRVYIQGDMQKIVKHSN